MAFVTEMTTTTTTTTTTEHWKELDRLDCLNGQAKKSKTGITTNQADAKRKFISGLKVVLELNDTTSPEGC